MLNNHVIIYLLVLMSILDPQKLNHLIEESFWITSYISTSRIPTIPILFHGSLFVGSEKNSMESHDYYLTDKHIYYYDLQFIKKAKITWCLLESFYESESKELKYGFSLANCWGRYDFYSSSSDSLDNWLIHLSKICPMKGFSEDFVIIKEIDEGRFGNVYLCQDIVTCKEYAVKEISKHLIVNEAQVNHLRNEISILRMIKHPNCIKLYWVYEDNKALYLILEYIQHGNLLERLRKIRKFTEIEVSTIIRSFIEILIYFNSLGIIHRDIKLENILMCSKFNNFECKLADFGLAAYSDKVYKSRCGSPGFMAPEILSGENYSFKADIYSVGIVGYTLLIGKFPFQSKSIKIILDKNSKGEIKYEKKIWKKFSPAAYDFISSLLLKDPNLRLFAEQARIHPWLNDVQKNNSELVTLMPSSNF